ncbi:SPOR domain-containing protein [Aquabacter cavernae]|uniref:SPOR domain-containing protein n=1 Tax=Aquabacter cavernae TaxID=2496029 RepID=UPI000F8EC0E4|nr:SPOR domain-containing protein [Aquabacter cavernae]
MGDDSSFRYRRDDGYPGQQAGSRSPQAADGPSAEDALAELARLIGQDDPFADFADIAEEPAPAPARPAREAPAPRPQFSAPPVERRFEDWQPGRRSARDAAPDAQELPPARESTVMRERTVQREAPTSTRDIPTAAREATGYRQPAGFAGGQAPAMPPRAPMPAAPMPAAPASSGRDAAFPPRESGAVGGLRGRAPVQNDWGTGEETGWGATEAASAHLQTEARSTVRSGYGSLARRGETQPDESPRAPNARHEQEAAHDPSRQDGAYAYTDSEQTRYADYDDTYDPAFDEEGYMPPHGEEVYETEPRRNKGRTALIAVAALVGLGVVATAGVMVFRGGGSGSSSTAETAPVIKADTSPSKVAGPTPANGQNGDGQKLIYDRVGGQPGQPGQERVVPREEQPMDVAAAAAAAAAGAPQQPASPTDPKRVRTVAVRSDGSIVPGANPPAAQPVSTGAAPTAYAPTQNPLPAGAPAPRTVTTTATTGQGGSVAAAAPAATQQAAVTPAAPPPAAAANGAYVVQVSSQTSEAGALGSFKVLQSRYPQLLGSYKPSVRRADLGEKGIFYRALVGPFASRDEANNLCAALQAQGGTCFVTRN